MKTTLIQPAAPCREQQPCSPLRGGYKARLRRLGFTVWVFQQESTVLPQSYRRRVLRINAAGHCVFWDYQEDRRIIGRRIREWVKRHEANGKDQAQNGRA